MRLGLRATAFLAAAILIPACGHYQGIIGPLPRTVANALLRGSQVVPALATGATGTATVTVDFNRKNIDYTIDQTGIVTVTAVELRLGGPGTNGPVLFTLPVTTFPTGGRLSDQTFFAPVGSVTTFGEACDAISAGNTYLLIRSAAQPTGEIRGHVGTAALASVKLTGSQENPPLGVTGTGDALVTLNDAQDEFTVTLNVSGVTGITAAQIFDGKPGVNGSAPLFSISSTAFTSSAFATLNAGNFTVSATITTFPNAINALLSGGLYVQVLTATNVAGEIRGQVGPTQMNAVLSGADFFNPVTTTATGSSTVTLNALQDGFLVQLTHTVVTPTAVTMHAQLPGSNGPQIFDVGIIAGAATSPVTATMTSTPALLVPNASRGINNFQDFVAALLTGQTYIQVASSGFTQGEIRGQFLP